MSSNIIGRIRSKVKKDLKNQQFSSSAKFSIIALQRHDALAQPIELGGVNHV